jgi:hypothetical protein
MTQALVSLFEFLCVLCGELFVAMIHRRDAKVAETTQRKPENQYTTLIGASLTITTEDSDEAPRIYFVSGFAAGFATGVPM